MNGRWVRRPGGIKVFVSDRVQLPDEPNPRAYTHQLRAALADLEILRGEVTQLRRILYSDLAGFGVICDVCGCLCKPREDCPMCRWVALENGREAA